MLDFIHYENLARFRNLLASATDEPFKNALRRRIAEETAAYALEAQQFKNNQQ